MFKNLLIMLCAACSSDVSIMKTNTSPATSDTSNITNEPSQTPDGLNGNVGYTNFYLRQVACPGCVGEQQELTVEYSSKFFENTTASHTDWIPPVGDCTNQLLMTVPTVNLVDMGSSLSVQGNAGTFTANYNGSEFYTTIYESMYERDTTYTVNFTDGAESFQFDSIHGFDSLEPFEMLYVDPSYAFAAPIYRTGTTFSWEPYGSDSTFMILIAVYTPDGSQLLGYVTCTSPDQGFMTIPGSYLAPYPRDGLTAIHLARHRVQYIPYNELGGYIESHMEWEVIGTGHIE